MTDDIEVERYELSRPPSYRFEIERRDFMRIFGVLGGGLLVASVSDAGAQQESGGGGQGSVSSDLAAWIHVDAAGRITGYTGKTEIGQNIRTSLAQAIADELRVPMATVALIMADTDLVPFDQGTFGSLSTPRMAPVLARAAVTAREMLIDRAAALWSVDRGTLTCKDGRITAAGRSIGFGDLVKDRKLAGIVPADAPVSPTAAWTVRGTAAQEGQRSQLRHWRASLHAGHHAAGNDVRTGHPLRRIQRHARLARRRRSPSPGRRGRGARRRFRRRGRANGTARPARGGRHPGRVAHAGR